MAVMCVFGGEREGSKYRRLCFHPRRLALLRELLGNPRVRVHDTTGAGCLDNPMALSTVQAIPARCPKIRRRRARSAPGRW